MVLAVTEKELKQCCFISRNLTLYKEFLIDKGKRNYENLLIVKLQNIGLLPSSMSCPTSGENCKVSCKPARVIDR